MYDNLEICPLCKGVIQDGTCTICGQQVKKTDSEEEEEPKCPNCKNPESKCICGE